MLKTFVSCFVSTIAMLISTVASAELQSLAAKYEAQVTGAFYGDDIVGCSPGICTDALQKLDLSNDLVEQAEVQQGPNGPRAIFFQKTDGSVVKYLIPHIIPGAHVDLREVPGLR